MRRRAGTWSIDGTAARPPGAERPRAGARVVWVVALIALLHGGLIAQAWQEAPYKTAARAARAMSVRVVAAPSAPRAAPVAPPRKAVSVPRKRTPAAPVPEQPPRSVAQTPPPPQSPPAPPAEPVSGAVFALPNINLGGPTRTRWTRPPVPTATPTPVYAQHAAMAQARAAHESQRAQIIDALQRQISGIESIDAADGRCALLSEPQVQLSCDSESLRQALAPREDSLAGLLDAYRRMEPGRGSLAVVFSQGRYQLAWDAPL